MSLFTLSTKLSVSARVSWGVLCDSSSLSRRGSPPIALSLFTRSRRLRTMHPPFVALLASSLRYRVPKGHTGKVPRSRQRDVADFTQPRIAQHHAHEALLSPTLGWQSWPPVSPPPSEATHSAQALLPACLLEATRRDQQLRCAFCPTLS